MSAESQQVHLTAEEAVALLVGWNAGEDPMSREAWDRYDAAYAKVALIAATKEET